MGYTYIVGIDSGAPDGARALDAVISTPWHCRLLVLLESAVRGCHPELLDRILEQEVCGFVLFGELTPTEFQTTFQAIERCRMRDDLNDILKAAIEIWDAEIRPLFVRDDRFRME